MARQRYDIVLCRDECRQLTLDAVASGAGLHPAMVERFVELGLIEPIEWAGTAVFFDPSAVPRLRLIVRLRDSLGINVAGIAVTLDLLDKVLALKRENETLRSRL